MKVLIMMRKGVILKFVQYKLIGIMQCNMECFDSMALFLASPAQAKATLISY
jgi:hypothetical protein